MAPSASNGFSGTYIYVHSAYLILENAYPCLSNMHSHCYSRDCGSIRAELQQLPRARRLRGKPNRVCTNVAAVSFGLTSFTRYPPAIESRRWQTPPKGASGWYPQYQDHSCLVGHARVVYSSDHLSANVTVVTLISDPSASVSCAFHSSDFGSCSTIFNSKFATSLQIQANAHCTSPERYRPLTHRLRRSPLTAAPSP